MKIAIIGAGGFIGKELNAFLSRKGHTIIPISHIELEKPFSELVPLIEGCDVIINLAGAPILGKWTPEFKDLILKSRVGSTNRIIDAINYAENKPKLFISTSAIGIYNDKIQHDESSLAFADDYLAEVCKLWEYSTARLGKTEIRTVIFRLGMVMGKSGGAYLQIMKPIKLGVGAIIGTGEQKTSYIQISDLLNAYNFVINNTDTNGIFNLTTPYPTTNKILTKIIAKKLHRKVFFKLPICILKFIYGDGAEVISSSRDIIPTKLLKAGFKFEYETIEEVIDALV